MILKDIFSGYAAVTALGPAVLNSDTNGATVDLKGRYGVVFALMVGVGGITFSTSNKIEVVMQESDNGSDWTPVAAGDVLGVDDVTDGIVKALTAAHAAAATYRFGYRGNSRYVRLVADFSGTHGTGTPLAATAIVAGMDNPQPDAA